MYEKSAHRPPKPALFRHLHPPCGKPARTLGTPLRRDVTPLV